MLYTQKDGSKEQVTVIVLELAGGGELFDFVAHTGPFLEKEARFFF